MRLSSFVVRAGALLAIATIACGSDQESPPSSATGGSSGGAGGASSTGGSSTAGTSSGSGGATTFPQDGPPAGYADGHAPIPQEAQAEDVSSPTTVIGTGTPASCSGDAFVAAVAKGGVITFD